MNVLLDLFIEVLHAHRNAIEPEFAQGAELFVGRHPRVDLNRNLRIRFN